VADVTVPAGIVAFARVHGEEAVLVAAPRLCSRLVDANRPMPLGGETWKTSRVLLPPALGWRTFRDEITGAEIRPASTENQSWIVAGQAFETLPIAILRAL
jgi:maltooligosyltrehalose synthase